MKKNIEVDKDEILKFEAMASEWWDPYSKIQAFTHAQPLQIRVYYISQIKTHFNCDYKDLEPLKD